METNDDDLEVAAVLAQGLGQEISSGQVLKSLVSETERFSNFSQSPWRSSTVLTNNSRGNTTAETPSRTTFDTVHQMAAKGELSILQEMNFDDVALNELDSEGLTPIMWAAMYGQVDVVSHLLLGGARTDPSNAEGGTCLMIACYHGNPSVVKVLLDFHVDIDQVDKEGNSALMYAVFGDQIECVRLLLDHGADLTQRNTQGVSAMDAAVKLRHNLAQKCLENHLIRCLMGS